MLLAACSPAAPPDVGSTPHKAVAIDDVWPPVAAEDPTDAMTADAALRALDGATIKVRAQLVALAPPCAQCNVSTERGESTAEDDRIGRTNRDRGPTHPGPNLPGCVPCPGAAVTFADVPGAPPLRVTGTAEALQKRHVGHVFVLTGTFHARGESGPELETTDVRAIRR